ncbi:hypothetical protein OESDEN_05445 [Oesophagostomum dentatum]|uniref:Uncharacterized protein n=1 Tax=Oesophagostomum dentatum TaxID=61180 RepID=A0A0B1TEV7_OESDE|nr:hypothetical protein OESDEN_05445 [Oesophagostomum dentatum]
MLIGRKDLELDAIIEGVHPSFIISEQELYERPLVGERMREEDPVGFIAGICNKFGSLIK